MVFTRSRRRVRSVVVVAVLALLALVLNAMTATAGATNIKTLFELDGNPFNNAAVAGDDWSNVLLPPSGDHSAIAQSGVINDPAGQTIYTTGGSKDDLDNNNWRHTSGSVPDKDEITNAYAAAYTGTNNELILYFGADRHATNGSANLGFWFFQKNVAPAAGGVFSGTPHTVGDILVLSQFTNGGSVPFIQVYEWVGSGGDTNGTLDLIGDGADCASAGPASNACATVNSGSLSPTPWPYDAKSGPDNVFGAGAFFEGGVNLSALFQGTLPCFSSFLAETRSSPSVDATLKDFVGGNFPLCSANIQMSPDAVNEVGESHTFTVTVNKTVAGASTPAPNGTIVDVTLTNANGAINSITSNTCANPGTTGGTCQITFTSNTAGTVTAHAEADVAVSDTTIHVETGTTGNDPDRVKRFVDARVSIDPDDTNSIGESHTFTVDVDQDDGLTAAQGGDGVTGFTAATVGDVLVTLTNAGGAANTVTANTCDVVAGDNDDDLDSSGQCTVTFTSPSAGTVTGHATATITVSGEEITRSTDATGNNSNDAVKTFVDGSLTWIKVDNQDNKMSANFEVCRTHNLNTGTGQMEAITPVCVTVADDILADNPDATTPDADNDVGEYLLEDLRLGRYTVDEVAPFPPGFEPDPDVETVDLTLASPNGSVATPFVNVALFKLIVITCNEVTEELVDGTVVMDTDPGAGTNNVTKETLQHNATLPDGVSEGELCGLAGANYGNLFNGQYNPSVELPDKAPLFP